MCSGGRLHRQAVWNIQASARGRSNAGEKNGQTLIIVCLLVVTKCGSLLQSIAVSLNRSDYMLDQSEDGSTSLKQIEFNTFSVAGFGVTDSLPEVHRYDEAAITPVRLLDSLGTDF